MVFYYSYCVKAEIKAFCGYLWEYIQDFCDPTMEKKNQMAAKDHQIQKTSFPLCMEVLKFLTEDLSKVHPQQSYISHPILKYL